MFIPEDTFDVNITQTVIADNANTGQEDYVASGKLARNRRVRYLVARSWN